MTFPTPTKCYPSCRNKVLPIIPVAHEHGELIDLVGLATGNFLENAIVLRSHLRLR